MYRRYYSYNDMPVPVKPELKQEAAQIHKSVQKNPLNTEKKKGVLENLKIDDIIILAVIFILFMDECDDLLLLAALAFIFLNRE